MQLDEKPRPNADLRGPDIHEWATYDEDAFSKVSRYDDGFLMLGAQVRKGMVLVDEKARPKASWEFTADIAILSHHTTIHPHYQVCALLWMSGSLLKLYACLSCPLLGFLPHT